MGRRWSQKEEHALAEVKRRLKDQLTNRPQYPEVVGDRRLMRFLRGKALNVDESTKMISAFLKWRDDNKVDDVRQDIVYGGKDSPFKFPFGQIIIDIAPQIVQSAVAMDRKGRPLAMEMFDFSPKEVLEAISIADYLVFLTYCLEYRALILEQMSHEREQKYLSEHPDPNDRMDGYGVVILDFTIRDLKGVGLAHLGSKGRALVGAALELGLPNYQEYLGKCVMVNTPWVFNAFWYFVKGFLDEETIAKINLVGANYMPTLLEDLTFENIPEKLGGGFKLYNEPFHFDVSPGGPLYHEPSGRSAGGDSHHRPSLRNRPNLTIDISAKPTRGADATSETLIPFGHVSPQNHTTAVGNASNAKPAVYTPPPAHLSWPETPPRSSPNGSLAFSSVSSQSQSHSNGYSGGNAGGSDHHAGNNVGGPASRTAATLLYPRVQRAGKLSVISTRSPYTTMKSKSQSPYTPFTPPVSPQDRNAQQVAYETPEPRQTLLVEESQSSVSSLSSTTDFPADSAKQCFADDKISTKVGIADTSSSKTSTKSAYSSPPHTPRLMADCDESAAQKWLLGKMCAAILREWSEFLAALYLVFTQHPVKTITTVLTIALFGYLRCQGSLHLLVFPVLFLTTLTYFELFR